MTLALSDVGYLLTKKEQNKNNGFLKQKQGKCKNAKTAVVRI